jgi:hypothetical protein
MEKSDGCNGRRLAQPQLLANHTCKITCKNPVLAVFARTKAGRVLDLYERRWEGVPLRPTDFVISADEKTSVQARRRKQPTLPGASGRPTRVEHEYFREGAWTYLAAWDVHRAKLFGRCEIGANDLQLG